MEHTYPGVVDHLVEQGWTKLVLFVLDNPSGVGPTTSFASHTKTNTNAHMRGQHAGPQPRSSVKQAARLLSFVRYRIADAGIIDSNNLELLGSLLLNPFSFYTTTKCIYSDKGSLTIATVSCDSLLQCSSVMSPNRSSLL
jgi:hypothetical protein